MCVCEGKRERETTHTHRIPDTLTGEVGASGFMSPSFKLKCLVDCPYTTPCIRMCAGSVVQFGAMWCSVVQGGAVWYNETVQYSVVQ